jgi:hypothetical protein
MQNPLPQGGGFLYCCRLTEEAGLRNFTVLLALVSLLFGGATVASAGDEHSSDEIAKMWQDAQLGQESAASAEVACDSSAEKSEGVIKACEAGMLEYAARVTQKYLEEQRAKNTAAPLSVQGMIDTHGFGLDLRGALGLPLSEKAYRAVYESLLAHQEEFETGLSSRRSEAFAEIKKQLLSSPDAASADLGSACDDYLKDVAPISMKIAGQLVDFCSGLSQ